MYSLKAELKLEDNLFLNIFSLLFLKYFCVKCILQNHITCFTSWLFSLGFIFVLVKPSSLNTKWPAIGKPNLYNGRWVCAK